jgi:predicted branched-subunit amino acid permease
MDLEPLWEFLMSAAVFAGAVAFVCVMLRWLRPLLEPR